MPHYRSKAALLGLPLVDIAIGPPAGETAFRRGVARGWIAVGDIAFGPLLAVGGIAAGGLTIGGLAVGLLDLAGLAVGVYTLGGLSAGFWAAGGLALGWFGAVGGGAISHAHAVGGMAVAPHANDAIARAYLGHSLFLRSALAAIQFAPGQWIFALTVLAAVLVGIARSRPPGETPSP